MNISRIQIQGSEERERRGEERGGDGRRKERHFLGLVFSLLGCGFMELCSHSMSHSNILPPMTANNSLLAKPILVDFL